MGKRIVIIGGGTGGTIVANLLARGLRTELRSGEVTVNMLSASEKHVYQPGFLYVAFGRMQDDEIIRDQRGLLDPLINLYVDPAVKIDTESQTVTAQSGRSFPYDYLVIATGSRIVPEEVPGLKEGAHWFYDLAGAKKLRKALKEFEGGRIVVSVGVPHKCPVAPLEVTFMLDDLFSQNGLKEKYELFYTYPIARVHVLEPVAQWAVKAFERRGIRYETFFNMKEVDPLKKQIHSEEGSTLDYDLLIAVPPHKGMPLIEESGLGADGWIPTDKHSLTMAGKENVFVVGDTTNIPISKAGSTAHFEADTVAESLICMIKEGCPGRRYDGKVFCFVETSLEEGTYVWFNYNTPPNPGEPSQMIHWFKLAYNRLYWLSARGIL
ncbi:MAG: NAD(P)/FAD-dependent oxidoreductase [Deltaproteobacteria bacterium]|nr:NAD(P)/FAD-dependent oxidoreductase [Deltaproteobacteria bacterium]